MIPRHTACFGVCALPHKEDRKCPHQLWGLEGVVLSKITASLPAFQVTFNSHWKHLTGLCLADGDFDVSGPVDVLLGADVFSRIILLGR